jgi:chromate transporter
MMDAAPKPAWEPGPLSVFWVFFRISAMTLGGGLAMVPVMAREMTKRSWMEEGEFYSVFSGAQAFPGPIALSLAFFLGKRLRGAIGAMAACLGVMVPPVLSVVFVWIGIGLLGRPQWLSDFFDGVYATVPGLAAALIYRMLRTGKWKPLPLAFAALLAAALILFKSLAVPIFFGSVALWYAGRSLWKSSN